MTSPMTRRLCSAAIACVLCSRVASSLPATFLGSEFQVNTYTPGVQFQSVLASDAEGDFVVVWMSIDQDGDSHGVFGQRFSSAGERQATEFQVNIYTPGTQTLPAVAMRDDGSFVVVWRTDQDTDGPSVFGRRFDALGVAVGAEIQVTSHTLSGQGNPDVAVGAGGDFVVVWEGVTDDGQAEMVRVRLFDASGVPRGVELQVTAVGSPIGRPAVATDDAGDFVVVWETDTSDTAIVGRRFDSAGTPQGFPFVLNSYDETDQSNAAIAMASDGHFVVVWESEGQDGSEDGVFGRCFDPTGVPLGTELQANAYATGAQQLPSVALADDGVVHVVWAGAPGSDVFLPSFPSTCPPRQLRVNSFTASAQVLPDVAAGAGGDYVVTWSSPGQDGGEPQNNVGVFAHRFGSAVVLDVDGDGSVRALGDGLLVVRFLFGLTGAALTGGAVDEDCTRCDAESIETYLATLI